MIEVGIDQQEGINHLDTCSRECNKITYLVAQQIRFATTEEGSECIIQQWKSKNKWISTLWIQNQIEWSATDSSYHSSTPQNGNIAASQQELKRINLKMISSSSSWRRSVEISSRHEQIWHWSRHWTSTRVGIGIDLDVHWSCHCPGNL